MVFNLELEFWNTDREGHRNNHQREQRENLLQQQTQQTQSRQAVEGQSALIQRIRSEEEERLRRDQERRLLRRSYRARFEEERGRYRQQTIRARGSSRAVSLLEESSTISVVQESAPSQAEEQQQEEEEYNEKMPRNQRYEALPQRPSSPIILSPIPLASSTYNYNSGVATSISSVAPSVMSIPNSPPPSFHTHSSPGTPRPSQAQLRGGHGAPQSISEELWGVADSTVGGETLDGRSVVGQGALGSSNDYLATITGLRQRVEWLEESMGRLLLEREKSPPYTSGKEDRTNCCVSFTDASPDIEQAFLARGTNCCVSFSGTASAIKRKERRFMVLMMLLVILIVCITVAVIVTKR